MQKKYLGLFDLAFVEAIASILTILCILLINMGHDAGPIIGAIASLIWVVWSLKCNLYGVLITNMFIGLINVLAIIGML